MEISLLLCMTKPKLAQDTKLRKHEYKFPEVISGLDESFTIKKYVKNHDTQLKPATLYGFCATTEVSNPS